VPFPSWNATPGAYLAKVFLLCQGRLCHDTVKQHFVVVKVGIAESNNGLLPREFALDIASPNPSRDAVTIHYALPKAADISLKLYDAAGKLRAVLDQGRKAAGEYSATFDARDSRFDITSGIYFVRLKSPGFERTRKVMVTP